MMRESVDQRQSWVIRDAPAASETPDHPAIELCLGPAL